MSEKSSKLSRRDFLKGAALVGAAAAGTSFVTGCSPSGAGENVKWDKEVDVLVVGSGTVAFAALAAKDAGAEKVLIIEKAAVFGGTSAVSGGGFWIPNNYAMKEAGIEDSREKAITYLKIVTEGQSTDELIEAYVDNAPKLLEWSRDKLKFEWAMSGTRFQDYYEVEGHLASGRTVGLAVAGEKVNGSGTWKLINETVDKMGIEVMLNTAGKKLYINEAGEVIGLLAIDEDGNDFNIEVKKGVILGTGGFDFNKDMRTAFLPGPLFVSNAVPTNTGDGHLMAMAIGADLRNMNSCWGLPSFSTDPDKLQGEVDWQMYRGKPGAVVVNKYGERIGNEASAYHVFNRAFYFWDTGIFEWRNIPSYFIVDSTFLENYPLPGSQYKVGVVPDMFKKADTLEGLVKVLGIEKDGFLATMTTFNENAKNGVDPVWHRGEADFDKQTAGDLSGNRTELKNNCLAPLEKGPFYGVAYYPGTCGTNGGLRIDGHAQVLNVWGQPIPRLYAVGNTSGSPLGAAYPGGGATLGQGAVFGMLAAQHAVGAAQG